MLRKLATAALGLVLLAPAGVLVPVAMIAATTSASAAAVCAPSSLLVTQIPESLTATSRDGATVTLTHTQLTHAATIITTGSHTAGVGRPGVLIALMAALTESRLRMLANTGAYPESADYPNDGNGADHDSLGLFQMRPASGWGTVAELMDPAYQAAAFYGGPSGPNSPSPRGLLDIPGWGQLDPGAAAQAVEVSAYPDRYANYQPVAEAILTALTTPANHSPGDSGGSGVPVVPETRAIVFPLPEGTWVRTSPFGPRTDPITGQDSFHSGSDFAAPDGTPILAIADGQVVQASYTESGGGVVVIEHTVGGQPVASKYLHMWASGIHVAVGDTVAAGQHIADVGSSGHSTGPHLHIEVHPGGPSAEAVDADAWLTTHHATGVTAGQTAPAACTADTTTSNASTGTATAPAGAADGGA